jgi:hypothetical protein
LLLSSYIHTKLFPCAASLFDKLAGGALRVLLLPHTLPDYTGTC